MKRADSTVKARIPSEVKERAFLALANLGLSASDLIRITFMRVADEGRLPFDLVPNAATQKAMDELDAGKGKEFESAEALFKDLGI